MNPRYTDFWAKSGRRYVPAIETDVAKTIARARREMRRAGEDPLDHTTWPAELQPPEPLGPPRTNRNTTKD